MDGTTALVTMRVADARYDLEVPADLALAELIPLLVTTLDSRAGTVLGNGTPQWAIGRPGAALPFAATSTLLQAGVVDGEELVLQDVVAWHKQPSAPYGMASALSGSTDRWVI